MLFLVFIAEITARAFIVADSNKRRTLSRADIAKALSKSDQFDFLIDIVPREEGGFAGAAPSGGGKKSKHEVSFAFTFFADQGWTMDWAFFVSDS